MFGMNNIKSNGLINSSLLVLIAIAILTWHDITMNYSINEISSWSIKIQSNQIYIL